MSHLNGRVFARLQQYDALPTQLKQQAAGLEQYLTSCQSEVFSSHRTMQLKSVYGVRTRPLLEKIAVWVKQHGYGVASASPSSRTERGATTKERVLTPTTTPATSNVGNYQIAGSATPSTVVVPPMTTPADSDPTADAHIGHAKKLLDALVLKGFVTPHREDKPEDAPSATEDLEFKDNELLVARAQDVAAATHAGPSVWDLVDGAVFAGLLKRKAGLLEPLTHGKHTYAVVNMRLKNLTLFSSDVGRDPVAQFNADQLKVSFDTSHYDDGVKVWDETASELLNAASPHESDALVQALLAVGATQQDQHGHAATTQEKLRHEVKMAAGTDHEKNVSDGDDTKNSYVPDRTTPHLSSQSSPATHNQPQPPGWEKGHAGSAHTKQPTTSAIATQPDGLPTGSPKRGFSLVNEPTLTP